MPRDPEGRTCRGGSGRLRPWPGRAICAGQHKKSPETVGWVAVIKAARDVTEARQSGALPILWMIPSFPNLPSNKEAQ